MCKMSSRSEPVNQSMTAPTPEPENIDASTVYSVNDVRSTLNEFAAGAVAGISGLVVGHPMDTVKVLMQNSGKRVTVVGVVNAVRQAGLTNFFRGLSVPTFSYAVVNAMAFGSYKASLRWLDPDKQPSALACGIAGAFSGLVQLIPSVPVEIIKIQQQNSATVRSVAPRALSCVRAVVRNHGILGLYMGTSMHALRDIPGFTVYFLSYSKLYQLNIQFGMSNLWSSFFAGATGGALSWCVSMPFDVVKTRMQSGQMHTAIEVLRDILKEKSYRVFFRGFQVVIIRAFAVNGVSFAVYEWTSSRLRNGYHGDQTQQENVILIHPDTSPPQHQ